MPVGNGEISRILYEIGEYLDMQGEAFKPRAYEKAAQIIEGLQGEVREIYANGGLKAVENIPGVGISIAEKIEELIKTGNCKYYEQLKKKMPVDLSNLTRVAGLGPKKIKALYQKLEIKNLQDLEKAAKAGKISKLEGFGPKSEENILKSLEFAKKDTGRFALPNVLPVVQEIEDRLRGLKGVKKAQVAGSVRRRKETIGDADILVISDSPRPVMDYFVSMPEVARVLANGETKSTVTLKNGLNVDVRVLPEESYGSALNYFTGSKDHNVALRQIAIKKGYKLSEYGLFKVENLPAGRQEQIAGSSEEEIYKTLGMDYIEPELREMTGEIEAALRQAQGKHPGLPEIIGYGDIRGDLQTQTNWTDGSNSIEEMAQAAMAKGLEYIAITDHTKRLAMTHGLDEKRIVQQMKEIDELNRGFRVKGLGFRVLRGSECDILKDGALDLPDEILKQLDFVGASVHSYFNLSREEQTERLIRAMKNPNVDMIFHPTGRIVQKREPYDLDMEKIIKVAKETGTILEINGSDRLDLRDQHIRMCVEAGIKMAIDSDAHHVSHFDFIEFGIAQARRGWATKKDIINAWPLEKMLKMLK